MKNKEEFITEEKVINNPAGGVLIGKDKDMMHKRLHAMHKV
jgi:hypothetical protein